jgi:recombination protein RecR
MVNPLRRTVDAFARLPGVGEKTAWRLTWWLLSAPNDVARELSEALKDLHGGVVECGVCCNVAGADPCRICADPSRDVRTICVVERPQDVEALEAVGEFRGRYHVLHGALSPLDGIGPDDLRLRSLVGRVGEGVDEVILATDPDVEGDTTALYVARLLKPLGVKVSRLAHGVAVGTEIEYADRMSLARALENRREL